MNGQPRSSSELTPQTKVLISLVGLFAVVGLVVRILPVNAPRPTAPTPQTTSGIIGQATVQPPPTAASAGGGGIVGQAAPQQASTLAPGGLVKVSILTTDTKAEWLGAVTTDFNAARKTTSAGHLIQAEMIQASGPEEMMQNLLENSPKRPVLWSPGDASYIEQANQLLRDRGQREFVSGDCPPVVWIPTGFVMWRPMAEALGWPDKPISWKLTVELAGAPEGWARYGHPEWGKFTLGHSHPDYSTTGKNMLASLAYAAAGKTSGLTPADVKSETVRDAFRKVEKDTYHYGLSTKALLTLMEQRGPGYLHAATSSETAFIYTVTHPKGTLQFPLVFVFPAEGTFWSDNPTCILQASWVSPEQREAAKIYRDFLLAPPQQDKAIQIGLRPAAAGVPLHAPISLDNGTDPRITPQTVPPLGSVSDETMAAIIDVFKETKKKATITVLLDMSRSMEGVMVKNAIDGTTSFLGQLQQDDKIYVYMFNDTVTLLQPFGRVGDVSEGLTKLVGNLYPQGQTTLYDAVCMAIVSMNRLKDEDQKAGEARLYGIVVLSDGVDTKSQRTQSDMLACVPSGEDIEGIKIYTIAYGQTADKDLLTRIANRSNGKFYAADPANIKQIYLQISAEQ